VIDGRTPSFSAADVPAGLRLVRAIDRAVLDVARQLELRPMELYALLLLESGGRLTTSELAHHLSASTSQAKQLALRLCRRGIAVRGGANGSTRLTPLGAALAEAAARHIETAAEDRIQAIDEHARVVGGATLAELTLPTLA
jgi:DNA-binding MarR family transcriptional regulator